MNCLIALALFCLSISAFIQGCAEVEIPKTDRFLKEPLGYGPIKIGMTKSQVISIYGEADIKGPVSSNEWSEAREEWIYKARYSTLPFGAGYLSEDLYLYFDGNNLTNISRTPIGKAEKSENEKESTNR